MRIKDINAVMERFEALPLDEKEYTAELIRKAYAEAARNALAKRVKASMSNHVSGKVRTGGVAELRKDLEG